MVKIIESDEKINFSDPDNLETQVREYARLKATLEMLESRQKELREALFTALDERGFEDDRGNLVLELPESVEGVARVEKQRRVSRKVNEAAAEEIIAEHSLEEDLYTTIRVIDQDAIMAALYEGKLSEDEVDRMYPPTVTWALRTLKS
jgi:hypothetical protein